MFRKIYITFFLFLLTAAAYSQQNYESDPEYIRISGEVRVLTDKQDRLKKELDAAKEAVTADPSLRSRFEAKIINLESELFDIQSGIASKTAQINSIKQSYIINSMGDQTPQRAGISVAPNSTRFIGDFFRNNLSAEEKRIMTANTDIDSIANIAVQRISSQYVRLREIENLLNGPVERQQAESLTDEAKGIMTEIEDQEALFTGYWRDLYDTKLYAYKRILDLLNVEQYVQYGLDNREKGLKRQLAKENATLIAPALNNYNRQKNFLKEYEIVIARKQGDDEAAIKLVQSLRAKDTIGFRGKLIHFPEQKYIDYPPLSFSTPYKSVSQIEYLELPTVGSVWSVRVSVLNEPMKGISAMKNATPVRYLVNEDGKYEYYIGLFRTKEEAGSGMSQLKAKGFKAPVLTEFRDGGKVLSDGGIVPLRVADYYYSVEFDMVTPEITKTVKNIAPDQFISKIGNKYILGIFAKYSEAVKARDAIGTGTVITIDKD